MIRPFENHMVIRKRIFVGQARLNFRRGKQGPKVLDFIFSSMFVYGRINKISPEAL